MYTSIKCSIGDEVLYACYPCLLSLQDGLQRNLSMPNYPIVALHASLNSLEGEKDQTGKQEEEPSSPWHIHTLDLPSQVDRTKIMPTEGTNSTQSGLLT